MQYLTAVIVMTAGVGMVLFVKGVLAARSNNETFDFLFFVRDNRSRLSLSVLGILCAAVIMFLDPLGYEALTDAVRTYYSDTLANFLAYGSPAVIGCALGGLALMLPAASTTGKSGPEA